ncbi:MAG TPA: dienelactone hydrolase family protein [Gemmatimonadales bacterium]|nr:dienelactone hydrolase family protein [Gemmatimonadales bacterium]
MEHRADHVPEPVVIPADGERLPGILTLPPEPFGLVIFAHGSNSSRFSARNRFVAEILVNAGYGTLLFDLLTDPEGRDRAKVFDIPLLAGRLERATAWASRYPATADLPIGYFGASTGAAAALVAAADLARVRAIVSRGGRPDLAGDALRRVTAPTLLIAGGADSPVIALNRDARERLGGKTRLVVVPGATHLFEEPGALETVAHLAARWFGRFLAALPPHAALPASDQREAHEPGRIG